MAIILASARPQPWRRMSPSTGKCIALEPTKRTEGFSSGRYLARRRTLAPPGAWRQSPGSIPADVFECASVDAATALKNYRESVTGARAGLKVGLPLQQGSNGLRRPFPAPGCCGHTEGWPTTSWAMAVCTVSPTVASNRVFCATGGSANDRCHGHTRLGLWRSS